MRSVYGVIGGKKNMSKMTNEQTQEAIRRAMACYEAAARFCLRLRNEQAADATLGSRMICGGETMQKIGSSLLSHVEHCQTDWPTFGGTVEDEDTWVDVVDVSTKGGVS